MSAQRLEQNGRWRGEAGLPQIGQLRRAGIGTTGSCAMDRDIGSPRRNVKTAFFRGFDDLDATAEPDFKVAQRRVCRTQQGRGDGR